MPLPLSATLAGLRAVKYFHTSPPADRPRLLRRFYVARVLALSAASLLAFAATLAAVFGDGAALLEVRARRG